MGIVLIKKSGEVFANCVKSATAKGMDIAKIKATESKDLDKELKSVKKTLAYHEKHLYLITVEDGKERKISATGSFTDKTVFLNIDGNAYVAITNDGKDGCFIRSYTRCSETATGYYWKGVRTKKCQNVNKADAELLISGMTFTQLLAKVKVCTGFRVATSKRQLKIEALIASKAETTAKAHAKAEAKKAKAEAVA